MSTPRIVATGLLAAAALLGSAAPALAHNNSTARAGEARDVVVTLEQSGAQVPVAGFVGPVPEQMGDAIYLRAQRDGVRSQEQPEHRGRWKATRSSRPSPAPRR